MEERKPFKTMVEGIPDDAKLTIVSQEEVKQFGCPFCGYRSFNTPMSMGGAATARCGECSSTFILLHESLDKLPEGFLYNITNPELRKVQKHPRFGTPSHGRKDNQPEHFKDEMVAPGEYFRSRGVGADSGKACFVCNKASSGGVYGSVYKNIAAFVQTKAAGERVVNMFRQPTHREMSSIDIDKCGARLDFREFEPDYLQVKITACNEHLDELVMLHMLTECANGVITPRMITYARISKDYINQHKK